MPNDDYIKRSEVIKHINAWVANYVDMRTLGEVISDIPAADVEPVRHGRWIRVQWVRDEDWQEGGYWILRCSECIMPYHSPTPYCPHCGVKMDKDKEK